MTLTEQINSAKLARSENGLLALFIENKEIGFFDVDHQYYGEETHAVSYIKKLYQGIMPTEPKYRGNLWLYPRQFKSYMIKYQFLTKAKCDFLENKKINELFSFYDFYKSITRPYHQKRVADVLEQSLKGDV